MSRAVVFTCRVVLAGAVVGALVVGFAHAAAHSEFGLMTLDAVGGAEPQSAALRARVVYANDREPVSTATVTVEGTGPGGAVLAPVPMAGGADGVYTVTVRLPASGDWTFRAAATAPEATAEAGFTATAPPSTTVPASPSGGGDGAQATGRSAGSAASAAADAGDGAGWPVPVAIVALVVLGLATAVVVVRGRRRRVR
jgi:hypothetical protein